MVRLGFGIADNTVRNISARESPYNHKLSELHTNSSKIGFLHSSAIALTLNPHNPGDAFDFISLSANVISSVEILVVKEVTTLSGKATKSYKKSD